MSDEIQLALGKLVVAFSELEAAVIGGIAEFFPLDSFSEVELLANALSFRKSLDVLDALVRLRCTVPETIQAWQKRMKEASDLEDKRNTFIHSTWEWNVKKKDGVPEFLLRRKRTLARRGKGRIAHDEVPSVQQLIACAEQMRMAAAKLYEAAEIAANNSPFYSWYKD
jgi:hypothetical protein